MKSPNDKTPDSNDGQDDHDIAMLFREQTITVPAELDDVILTHAKNAVDKTEATTVFKPANRRINQWFALAATVVIGISVTPLLLRAPESTLPAENSETTYRAPEALDAADENNEYALQQPQKPIENSQPASSPAADDLAGLPSGIVTDSAVLEQSTALASRLQEQASGNNLSPQTKLKPSKLEDEKKTQLYRSTAKTWLIHIRALVATEKLKEAEDEFERFRKAYPDEEPDLNWQLMKTNPSHLSPTRPKKPDE